jgi:hypothetical protein
MDEEKEVKPKEKPKRTKKPKSGKVPGPKVLTIEKGIFVLVFD